MVRTAYRLAAFLCGMAAATLAIVPSAGAGGSLVVAERVAVDLELVIAADVSTSMDRDEKRLQLMGFVQAFRDPDVLRAIMRGRHGRIAVTYVEWGGEGRQRVVVPWTLVADAAGAHDFADRLYATFPGRMTYGTAMGEALSFAAGLFGGGYAGERRVIDISGDGTSNRGRELAKARADVLARGIVINGLPLVYRGGASDDPDLVAYPADDLIAYFDRQVIGGPDAFVVPVRSIAEFPAAVRHKLIREIAGAPPVAADLAELGER